MRKWLIVFIIFFNPAFFTFAENSVESETSSALQTQVDPWTTEIGTQFTMPFYAQVKKDGVLFEPTGLLLGVFKDNKCWGYKNWINGPVGKVHQVTVVYNTTPASGFTLKAYDPATGKFYSVTETINFASNTPVGSIAAPQVVNILSELTTEVNVVDSDVFRVFPSLVEQHFNITLSTEALACVNVAIYNVTGSLVKTLFVGSTTGERVIAVQRGEEITNGLYIVKATVGKKHFIQKVVFK